VALLEREPLLRQLSGLLAAARHGHGRVALLVGEAGIGKTALAEAFCEAARPGARVLFGTCDPLEPPRPFTPFLDIAQSVGGRLTEAIATGDRDRTHDAFLALLRRFDAAPAVVVLDDLHWADHASLELLQVIGRRIARLPALLIGTYRDHDVGPDHPLRLALGDVPAASTTELRVPPLTLGAIERLAGDRTAARALLATTSGNAFFVTEAIAVGDDVVPTTVRDAVVRRVDRLSSTARDVVGAAAVLGPRSASSIVLEVAGAAPGALEESVTSGLLESEDGTISFRHELARRAVLDAMPASTTRALHRHGLAVLRHRTRSDWAGLARHAIGADDAAAVLEIAPRAGDLAEVVGGHREAAAFFAAAVAASDALGPRDRAALLERQAQSAALSGDVPAAIAAREAALEIWRSAGDRRREAACLTELSLMLWLAGSGADAFRAAETAADLLERVAPGTRELARAWAVLAQRHLVESRDDDAIAFAERALVLAESVGEERVAVHALTTAAVAQIFAGLPAGWPMLEAAVSRGREAGLEEETARALINLVESARDFRRFDLAAGYVAQASAFLDEFEVGLYHHLLRTRIAAIELETGGWTSALAHARHLLALLHVPTPVRVRALTIAGLVGVRRGAPDARALLDEALALVGGEPQDLAHLAAARAEAAWLDGDLEGARGEAERGLDVARHDTSPWWWSELAFWSCKSGASDVLPHPTERPYWLHVHGRHEEAAESWHALGAPYQEAMALADSGSEAALRHALTICNELGARPLGRRIARRLRELGADGIARGPRAATRGNPAQLTDRQLEILGLVAAGLANAEIARRLVISPKTVDHHVSALLVKLAVPNRAAAANRARALGIAPTDDKDGEPRAAT
jgi:DNA-binding CsgD family transcriptional regulator/tetratricopeptide (TPR) repeat protein